MDFDARRVDQLASADIVVGLHGLEDATWSEWRGIGEATSNRASCRRANSLSNFGGSASRNRYGRWARAPPAKSTKGYYRRQFEAAWQSYCQDGKTIHRHNVTKASTYACYRLGTALWSRE
jgi:Protein of unknown function (DUF3631)